MPKSARSDKILTPEFRVSYPAVFKPRENRLDPSKPATFGCSLVFPPGADISALKAAAKAVALEQWSGKPPFEIKNPFLDAHAKDKGQGNFEPGSILLRTSSQQRRPGLVDANMDEIITEADFYAGCFARATVNAYAWATQASCGVSFGLINLQKTRDGEPIGFSADPQDDFKPIDPDSLGGETAIGADTPAPSFMD